MKSSASAATAAASHLVAGRAPPAVRDVLVDRPVEDEGLLQQQRDVVSRRPQRQPAQILAVQQDPAEVGVIEAEQQLRQRRLAGTARADQRQHLAGLDRKRDARDRVPLGLRIAEGDVVELEPALSAPELDRARRLDHRRLLVEHLDDPLRGRRGGVDPVDQPAHPADRAVELRQEGHEDEQAAERQVPLRELPGPEPDHEQGPAQLDQVDQRRVQRLQPDGRHLGADSCPGSRGGSARLPIPPDRRPGPGRRWRGSPPPPS